MNPNLTKNMQLADSLEELRKYEAMKQMQNTPVADLQTPTYLDVPNTQMDFGAPAGNVIPNRELALANYRQNLMDKMVGSEDRLLKADEDYAKSKEMGWGQGLSLIGSGLADAYSAYGGGKGGYTSNVANIIGKGRTQGRADYKDAIKKEQDLAKEFGSLDKKELETLKIKDMKSAMDPDSEESINAREFVKEQTGFVLPETANALQAKVFIDKAPQLKLEREKMGIEKEKYQATQKLAQDKKTTEASKYKTDLENKLRKEINSDKETKEFIQVKNMLANVQQAATGGSAADDLALIFSYMKILDPGSVVREGEFANAEKTQGIPDRILLLRNKILAGNRLTPEQRKNFVNSAENQFKGREKNIGRRYDQYRQIAERQGLDVDNVIYDARDSGVDMNALSKNLPGNMQMSKKAQGGAPWEKYGR